LTGSRAHASPLVAAVAAAVALAGCGADSEPAEERDANGPQPADSGNFEGRFFERNFVFAAVDGDSVFIVPWMMQATESQDSVRREAHAWLSRGGVWDAFYEERWATPPELEATLVLPHGGLSLLVREGGAIDGLVFEEGLRALEIILGQVGASWTDARGGSFEVLTGSAYLAGQRIDGMVLDVSRVSVVGSPTGGDWAFLLSGDSAQFVFAADAEHGGDVAPLYRGWADLGDEEIAWPEVGVDWGRTEAFPPARRDVPVAWEIEAGDGSMRARLEAVSAEMTPGEGPGPLLPVRALYEVVGTIEGGDGSYPVHGVLVHQRR
jgi:hypothetical protein